MVDNDVNMSYKEDLNFQLIPASFFPPSRGTLLYIKLFAYIL